jgi:hypothetical protein
MRAYLEYVLACQRNKLIPMPKQAWMQLGMPNSPLDGRWHFNWLKNEDPEELKRRSDLFDRIKGGSL